MFTGLSSASDGSPASRYRGPNVALMLVHRLKCKTTLGQRLVSAVRVHKPESIMHNAEATDRVCNKT